RTASGEWGVEIAGGASPRMSQQKAAQIELYSGAQYSVSELAAGYQSVRKEADEFIGAARMPGWGGAVFGVEDHCTISGDVLTLSRKVSVTSAGNDAGFYSAIRLSTAPTFKWEDGTYLI